MNSMNELAAGEVTRLKTMGPRGRANLNCITYISITVTIHIFILRELLRHVEESVYFYFLLHLNIASILSFNTQIWKTFLLF